MSTDYPRGQTKKLPAGKLGMKQPGDGSVKPQDNSKIFGGDEHASQAADRAEKGLK